MAAVFWLGSTIPALAQADGRGLPYPDGAFDVAHHAAGAAHDVVVVGAGLAGMRAAIEASRYGVDVGVVH